jgi:hypothetical protein
MNERIYELADRAGEYADFESGICTDEFLEKFAELLIRECSAVADNWVNNEDNGKNLVSDKLKEHFGVEQ